MSLAGRSTTTEECVIEAGAEKLAATKIYAASGDPPCVVSFHGTGITATRGRIRYLLDDLAAHGVSSGCFDFSGHGQSTGRMEQSTLSVRVEEARAAAGSLAGGHLRAVIGTSMGAHVAALLSPILRPRSLFLFSPAAYPAEAAEIPFNDDFTALARRPGAYRSSPAFEALSRFGGDLLIVAGGKDDVIPKEVVDRYAASAPRATTRLLWFEDAPHRIHPWLQEHPAERETVVHALLASIQGATS
jgi:pimeloyl-ACP methyl ester carboxylesterase